jgi:hypothetical protein
MIRDNGMYTKSLWLFEVDVGRETQARKTRTGLGGYMILNMVYFAQQPM